MDEALLQVGFGLGVGALLRSIEDIQRDNHPPHNRDTFEDPLGDRTRVRAAEPIFPLGWELAFVVIRPLWLSFRADLVGAPLGWSVSPGWSVSTIWLELAAGLRVVI